MVGQNKRILIAGAAGALGEPLALELRRRGHDVYGLIRNPDKGKNLVKGEVKLVIGSITDPAVVESIVSKVDIIVNSTSEMGNLEIERKAFDAITAATQKAGGDKKKVIFMSGGLVYAPSPAPLTETSPVTSIPFIQPRLLVEQDVIQSKNFHGTVARLPFFYGGDHGHWTNYFEHGEKGKLELYGDGNNIISYCHIDDLVTGVAAIIEADPKTIAGEIFNVAEFDKNEKVTIKDIALAFAAAAGSPNPKVENVPWPANFAFFDVNVWMDTTKIEHAIGWKARHNIRKDAKVLYDSWKISGRPGAWF